jgi:acetaldehyde dehydrogenase (acetylating)
MPAMRVLVNTAAPQGSTGVTTNLQPSMTLGCGAMAGNVTGDNVGPQHLINIKRLAYGVRRADEVLKVPAVAPAVPGETKVDRQAIAAAVEKYLAERGIKLAGQGPAPQGNVAAEVVDRFLSARRAAPSAPPAVCPLRDSAPAAEPVRPPKPEVTIVDFVCEADVREAIQKSRKIFVGPQTIVTPAARDLGNQYDILVVAQR